MHLTRALAGITLLASSAYAQTGTLGPPPVPIRPVITFSLGPVFDSGEGMLLAAQGSVGARRGVATGRLRVTAASTLSIGVATETRTRWEIAALGGVTLGDRAHVFLGAGPGLTGGGIDRACFLSTVCPDETLPSTLGLALGLDAAIRTTRTMRVGVQTSANLNPNQSVVGIGLLIGFGQ